MSKRKRSSQTQAVIQAALAIAQEHSEIILANNRKADDNTNQLPDYDHIHPAVPQ